MQAEDELNCGWELESCYRVGGFAYMGTFVLIGIILIDLETNT